MKLDKKILKDFKSLFPVKADSFTGGYIWGKNNQMIADIVNGDMRVRGWGRISKFEQGEEYQDFMQQFIAEAINEKYKRDYE